MFSYLIPADYQKQIQDVNLQQIIGSTPSVLEAAQLAAESEAKSYLRQKYDVAKELDATTAWDPTKIYLGDNTVYLDAPAYNPGTGVYALTNLTLQNNNIYICIVAVPIPEAFNSAKWVLIGPRYQLFYGKLPQPLFNYMALYKKTNPVFWKDFTYVALQDSVITSPDQAYQQGTINNTPVSNPFPDDLVAGPQFWGTGTAYSIPAGTLPTNTAKWVVGDNRDQQMVMYFVDITLYHVHSRIAPRNIPELRIDRYHAAINWLKMCADGAVTPELPVLQPKQGGRIRFGGNVKAQNSY